MTTHAKRDAREFERFYASNNSAWSPELQRAGTFALLSLKSLDQPNVPEMIASLAVRDLAAFHDAYNAATDHRE